MGTSKQFATRMASGIMLLCMCTVALSIDSVSDIFNNSFIDSDSFDIVADNYLLPICCTGYKSYICKKSNLGSETDLLEHNSR